MATPPPPLKRLAPFLQRAKELDRADTTEARVVAYFCRKYAATTGIRLRTEDSPPEVSEFLSTLLDELEKEKATVPQHTEDEAKARAAAGERWPLVIHLRVHRSPPAPRPQQFLINFGMKIFKRADDEDRAGNADRCAPRRGGSAPRTDARARRSGTAKSFYVAANFLTVLKQFGEPDEQVCGRESTPGSPPHELAPPAAPDRGRDALCAVEVERNSQGDCRGPSTGAGAAGRSERWGALATSLYRLSPKAFLAS